MKLNIFLLLIPFVTLLSPKTFAVTCEASTTAEEAATKPAVEFSAVRRFTLERTPGLGYNVIRDVATGEIISHLEGQFVDIGYFVVSPDRTRAIIRSEAYQGNHNYELLTSMMGPHSRPGTRVLDLHSGGVLGWYPNSDGGRPREFCDNGKLLVKFPSRNQVVIQEIPSGKTVFEDQQGFLTNYSGATISPDGKMLILDSTFSRWLIRVSGKAALKRLEPGVSAFSSSGNTLVNVVIRQGLGNRDLKSVEIHDLSAPLLREMKVDFPNEALRLISSPRPQIFFSPDEKSVAVEFGSGEDRSVFTLNREMKSSLLERLPR